MIEEIIVGTIIVILLLGVAIFTLVNRPKKDVVANPNNQIFQHTQSDLNSLGHNQSEQSQPLRFEIVCLQGSQSGVPSSEQRFPVSRGWFTIGRSPDHDIVIERELLVSSNHAAITIENDQVTLNDLNSANGTWVAGQRISGSSIIGLQEPFQIGPCIFVVNRLGQHLQQSQVVNQPIASASFRTNLLQNDVQRLASQLGLTLIDQIGEGGAALVYLCQTGSGHPRALKVVNQKADEYFKRKFHEEIIVGNKLKHGNIVTVHSSGYSQEGNIPYILMEYMDGGSLKDYLDQHRVVSPENLIHIIGQVCMGLAHAHYNQVYHRDIKPENILFTGNQVVKVADFGIAKLTENTSITQHGALIGTPHYMSFEQARALPVDHRSDQYSVGIIMYQMLAGRVPFDGQNPLDIVGKHIKEAPQSLRHFSPQIPEALDLIVLKTLEKDKNLRFQHMVELAEHLGFPNQSGSVVERYQSDAFVRRAYLIGVEGYSSGERIELNNDEKIISRDLFVGTPGYVSRQHARIYLFNDIFVLEDLNSANGTFINRHHIKEPTQLIHGCYVSFGKTTLQFIEQ